MLRELKVLFVFIYLAALRIKVDMYACDILQLRCKIFLNTIYGVCQQSGDIVTEIK